VRHREGKCDRDCRIDSVSAFLQYRYADVGCEWLLCGDHHVTLADGFAREGALKEGEGEGH
jgi:hypothetical protein